MDDRDEFMAWAADLFASHGWKVSAQPTQRPDVPDMIAVKRGWLAFVGVPPSMEPMLLAITKEIDVGWEGPADDLRGMLEWWATHG
jgi:hypothetical protein